MHIGGDGGTREAVPGAYVRRLTTAPTGASPAGAHPQGLTAHAPPQGPHLRGRFSRIFMLISMGVPWKPNSSRSRRSTNLR